MKNYSGITADDMVSGSGGSFVKKYQDAGEKYNFLDYNNVCYGYFQLVSGEEIHIERIDGSKSKDLETEDVLVVWCAYKEQIGKNVIVGWYRNAIVYRYYQEYFGTVNIGHDGAFYTKAVSSDCSLLPEKDRLFEVPRASVNGPGRGMGHSNHWYADSEWAVETYIPDVLKYIENYKGKFINIVYTDKQLSMKSNLFENPEDLATNYEKFFNKGKNLLERGKYLEALKIFNRINENQDNADAQFYIGIALRELNQFDKAIKIFEKVIEMEGENWENLIVLPYLYSLVGQYQDAVRVSEKLLLMEEAKENSVTCEIYSCLADNNMYQENFAKAIDWLNRIISESKDKELIKYTKNTKEGWSKYLTL